jgi:hypothetical protein
MGVDQRRFLAESSAHSPGSPCRSRNQLKIVPSATSVHFHHHGRKQLGRRKSPRACVIGNSQNAGLAPISAPQGVIPRPRPVRFASLRAGGRRRSLPSVHNARVPWGSSERLKGAYGRSPTKRSGRPSRSNAAVRASPDYKTTNRPCRSRRIMVAIPSKRLRHELGGSSAAGSEVRIPPFQCKM